MENRYEKFWSQFAPGWCLTRIDIASPTLAEVSILSFGADKPPRVSEPTVLKKFELQIE